MTAPPIRYSRSDLNFYADPGIDRASEKRKDPDFVRGLLGAGESYFVPVWNQRSLVEPNEPRAVLLPASEHPALAEARDAPVFLGLRGRAAYFALDVSHLEGGKEGEAAAARLAAGAAFVDLRFVSTRMDRQDGGLLAYANGMVIWHSRHRHCGACGARTAAKDGGFVRVCTDAACGLEQFPRTDPAVIMLVTDGDRCLLGRAHRFPPGMYSTLAGFVEPGETLEHAVAREVFEESGVRVRNVRYHSSQPWPFPTSLMLGYYAEAADPRLDFDGGELADCRWFERDWLLEQAARKGDDAFRLPRPISIARRLLDDWLAGVA
jgi:NAD+ diphosphatase